MKKILLILGLALSINVSASIVETFHANDCTTCHQNGKRSADLVYENKQCAACHKDFTDPKHRCTDCHLLHVDKDKSKGKIRSAAFAELEKAKDFTHASPKKEVK